MKKNNFKVILLFAITLLILTSCTESKNNKKEEEQKEKNTEKSLVKKGIVQYTKKVTDNESGIEIFFYDGSHFMSQSKSDIKLEGIKTIDELMFGENVEITFEPFAKEEIIQFVNTPGVEILSSAFIKKVDGRKKQTKELYLVSYELKSEEDEARSATAAIKLFTGDKTGRPLNERKERAKKTMNNQKEEKPRRKKRLPAR